MQPPFEPKPTRPPLDELINTVLSQHTSDVNSARAFNGLRARFPSWEEVVHAPVDEVADAIRSGGIAEVKARRIHAILGAIEEREGKLDLGRLAECLDAEATHYLTSLPGVGPKTAACVLAFSLRRPAFPIDTHVHRVAIRLALLPPRTPADEAHRLLGPRVPPEIRYEFHVRLVRHGREVCRPQQPRCSACVLFDLCDAGPRFVAAGEAR